MSILLLFLVLFPLVIVHEFGHFIVAKKFGIRVDEFAFGFPPRLWSYVHGETRYAFNLLPIGGYVKIYGENPNDVTNDADQSRSFTAKPRFVQAAVIVAGVVFNLLFAWLLISTTLMMGVAAPAETNSERVRDVHLIVTEVRTGSPAALAGLQSGDTLVGLGDEEGQIIPSTPESVSSYISPRNTLPTTLIYEREGERYTTIITPITGIVPDRAAIGISMDMVGTLQLPPHIALWEGLSKTYAFTAMTAKGLFGFLGDTLMGKGDFTQVTGPVGMVRAVGDAAGVGVSNLILFAAVISISLAVINVIPFPALDGGRLLFIIIEAIMRRPIPARIANYANFGGFALLMLLMVLVTYHDVVKLLN